MAVLLSFQTVCPLCPSTSQPLWTATHAKLSPPDRFSPPHDRNSYAPGRCNSMAVGHMLARRFGLPLLNKAVSSRRAITTQRFPRARTVALAAWKQEVLWAEAPLVEVERAAESLYHVVLDISDNPELMEGHTTPGQFVQVRVGDSKPAFLAIASPPATSSGGSLEFLIKYVEGSTAGSLCNLRKGDTVELSQVLGNGFDIRQISPPEKYSTVLLFATGSGISPIRSLLESGLEASKRSDVTLYYGARNLQRMAYQERFKEWESSGVKIVPVLSQPDDYWTGERGYVQEAFARAKQIQNPSASGAVLCGHNGMAEDVTSLLASNGVSKERILKNF